MRIIEDDIVTLKRVRFRFERSRICINGRCSWFTIDGITLEKVIQIGRRYLLFVSTNEGDTRRATCCYIYMISQSGRIFEQKIIRAKGYYDYVTDDDVFWDDYDCWVLERFSLIQPNIVTFKFDDMIYSIEVLDNPVYHWFDYLLGKRNDQRNYFSTELLRPFKSYFKINIIEQK